MNIKEEFSDEIAYIQDQFRLIEEELYYGGINGSQGNGSLRKISSNIKECLNEIFNQIQKGEGSKRNQELDCLFDNDNLTSK